MLKILKWYKYTIKNEEGTNNKLVNDFDYALTSVYVVISLVNVCSGIGNLTLVGRESMEINANQGVLGDEQIIRTILLLCINIIILLRLNIKLYIKQKKLEDDAIMNMCMSNNNDVKKIEVEALRKRINTLKLIYVIDIVIFIMNMVYGASIETSLSVIVAAPILVTGWDNFIDIAEDKYLAKPNLTYRTTIH